MKNYSIFLPLLISACMSRPSIESLPPPKSDMVFLTKELIINANFGSKVSKGQFENALRKGFGFFDPYSAVIVCTEPLKGASAGLYEAKFGYIAKCTYNAKNQYGGYVGEKEEMLLLSNESFSRPYPGEWQYVE